MSSTTTRPQQGGPRHGANGGPKAAEKKPADPKMLLALLATDWCHGDRHFAAQIQAMAIKMLDELGGVDADGDPPAEPTEEQAVALQAKGRLEGAPNITINAPVPPVPQPAPVTTQPARDADERRYGQPQAPVMAQQPHGSAS